MAARLNKRHSQSVRDLIDVQGICRALDHHVKGQTEMSSTQIQAAKILLDKSISNAPTDVNSNVTGSITFVLDKADVNI